MSELKTKGCNSPEYTAVCDQGCVPMQYCSHPIQAAICRNCGDNATEHDDLSMQEKKREE